MGERGPKRVCDEKVGRCWTGACFGTNRRVTKHSARVADVTSHLNLPDLEQQRAADYTPIGPPSVLSARAACPR